MPEWTNVIEELIVFFFFSRKQILISNHSIDHCTHIMNAFIEKPNLSKRLPVGGWELHKFKPILILVNIVLTTWML